MILNFFLNFVQIFMSHFSLTTISIHSLLSEEYCIKIQREKEGRGGGSGGGG